MLLMKRELILKPTLLELRFRILEWTKKNNYNKQNRLNKTSVCKSLKQTLIHGLMKYLGVIQTTKIGKIKL